MSSGVAGVPYAISNTPTGGSAGGMNEVDDAAQDVGIGLGEDSVAEVEDVARPPAVVGEDLADGSGHDVPWRQAGGGIEVALHGDVRSHPLTGGVQWHPPVDAD